MLVTMGLCCCAISVVAVSLESYGIAFALFGCAMLLARFA